MEIDFDPKKDAVNLAKHGISLAEAKQLDWDAIEARVDDSQDYGGEVRWIGTAPMAGRPLHTIVFVEIEPGQRVRAVSLRRSTKREFEDYVKQKGG